MTTETARIQPGDHAPWFKAPALSGSPAYAFDTVAGRHVLMLFFGSARDPRAAEALAGVQRHRGLFDDDSACFFGVTADPEDAAKERISQELPGIRFFLDYQGKLSELYGAMEDKEYRPRWLLLDPRLRILDIFPIGEGKKAISALRDAIAGKAENSWAPVLEIPDIFEPELCRELIGLYESDGGEESGFMRDVGGKTVHMIDHFHKQRRDFTIEDAELKKRIGARVTRRINPAVLRSFQFRSTRMERYIVACYEPGAGHFRPHRDNTTLGTAHRKFAVTINLNAGDYEGGDLRFPEFGARTYRAPTGGAIVFSCGLLHEATPVTRGKRYAFLPFLYDEEGARIREKNDPFLAEGGGQYRMDAKRG
jgi:predicted 2-oxoglutarate/Fe(II)-dependent dioxygenase YbiX/peroxiredoxin